MTVIGVSTAVSVLAIIGLVVGLVILLVVIFFLNDVLKPLRGILRDVKDASKAPMLDRGTVPGVEMLDQTHRLAGGVPDLAVRYMQKLNLPVDTSPPPKRII